MAATEAARQEPVDGAGPPSVGHVKPSSRCSRLHSGATLSTREPIIGENDLLRFANRND